MKNSNVQSTYLGMNRTGIDVSPIESKETIGEAERTLPSSKGDVQEIFNERSVFIKKAEPLGSVPPPGTLRGIVQTGLQKVALRRPEVFIDKLAERLSFERTGTRLYEALINKCEVRSLESFSIPFDELRRFRDAEHRHFQMLWEVMKSIGADPTALTPSADVTAVESLGLFQVLTDPRTSIAQSVHAILVAELTDHDGWKNLIEIAEAMNQETIAEKFRTAFDEEQIHLQTIRSFYSDLVREDANVAA